MAHLFDTTAISIIYKSDFLRKQMSSEMFHVYSTGGVHTVNFKFTSSSVKGGFQEEKRAREAQL